MVGYGLSEGDGEERDLNEWIEDRTRVGISGGFGVPGVSYNDRRVVEFCA